MSSSIPAASRLARFVLAVLAVAFVVACGGDEDPAPANPADAAAPAIAQQPADVTVVAGQDAAFAVVASGSAPLTYQWQRNGSDVAGATAAAYTLAGSAASDDGAAFHVVVRNATGTVTSRDAVLTVTSTTPVLTVTQQPADASVAAGATATFTVAATCSAGTLHIQWQRDGGTGGAFAAIAGETAASLAVAAGSADNGAQFRAALDCGGLVATTSGTATLAVTAATVLRVDPLPVAGLRPQGIIGRAIAAAQAPDGSVVFLSDTFVARLSADLSTITRMAGPGGGAITDGPAASAGFSQLYGAAVDATGVVYLGDNSTVRKIALDGTVSTLAGTSSGGLVDGTGAAARFGEARAVALGPDGDLYVADSTSYAIRRVTAAGVVTTYAGTGVLGYHDGAAGAATFGDPEGIAVAANGDVLVADASNNVIRRIARSGSGAGSVTTLAGSGATGSGADGVGSAAVIDHPIGLAVHGNTLFVLQETGVVRQVDLTTAAVTTLAGTYDPNPHGYGDGTGAAARFSGSGGIAALADGRVLVADGGAIRVISTAGAVTTIAVSGFDQSFATNGGTLAQAPFSFASNTLQTLAVDPAGRVVVASAGAVRRVAASGAVSLVAGLPTGILGMVDGAGSAAQFSALGSGIAAAPDGTLYVSDAESLRRIDPAGNTTLLAGYRVVFADASGNPPYGAVDGDAASARFQNGLSLAAGPDGLLYVADLHNCAIRRVDASGNTSTWAGAFGASAIVDGARTSARFRAPGSIAFAPDGSLYVVDNGVLRQVSADGMTVSTVSSAVNGRVVAVDAAGDVFLGASDGLYEIRVGATAPVLLVAGGNNDALVTGTSPHLGRIDALSVIATGQLALISGDQLVKVTLP